MPPNAVRAGPASKKGVTLNSVLRTGSIEGLHYYGVAFAFSEGGYREWFGTHRFDRAAAADPKRPCGPPEAQSVLRAVVRHVVQPLDLSVRALGRPPGAPRPTRSPRSAYCMPPSWGSS